MDIHFSLDDVFRIAMEVETRGRKFYEQGAKDCPDPLVARMFSDMAKMEAEHEQIFDSLRQAVVPSGKLASSQTRDFRIVSEMLLRDLEQDLTDRFRDMLDPQEVLREALEFEKDTIVLMLTLKKMLDSAADQKKVDVLVQEELGHVLLLGTQMGQLRPTKMPLILPGEQRPARPEMPS